MGAGGRTDRDVARNESEKDRIDGDRINAVAVEVSLRCLVRRAERHTVVKGTLQTERVCEKTDEQPAVREPQSFVLRAV